MNFIKIVELEAAEILRPFFPTIENQEAGIRIHNFDSSLTWKEAELDLQMLGVQWPTSLSSSEDGKELRINTSQLSSLADVRTCIAALEDIRSKLLRDNLKLHYWKTFENAKPTGFVEGELEHTEAVLSKLYEDKRIVAEKKRFLVDLEKSTGPYLVASKNSSSEAPSLIHDAASQIASLAIGHNHPSRSTLLARPELQDMDLDLDKWDVAQALRRIVREQSGLKNVYFCNSGAESYELSLYACQLKHPTRRKILAFEGSFHGRTLLALHSTYNPTKRLPFQIYDDLVNFAPFPEDKTPAEVKNSPEGYLKLWKSCKEDSFPERLKLHFSGRNELFDHEIECLLKIRDYLLQEPHLCITVEPMQCEGGDRYGSNRFFQALRIMADAVDTPYILDEVQTGFGLGRSFFWHRDLELPIPPDAIWQAKKSQVAFCACDWDITDYKEEVSPASIQRGYVQAVEVLEKDSTKIENLVSSYLGKLQELAGSDLILNTRCRGYAFAFDFPEAEWVPKFVSKRFPNGLLFYPAGSQTARFRLLTEVTESDIYEIFHGVYQCLKDMEQDGLFAEAGHSLAPIEQWDAVEPEEFKQHKSKPSNELTLPWPAGLASSRIENWEAELGLKQKDWTNIFKALSHRCPQLLRSPYNDEQSLTLNATDIAAKYQQDPNFSKLDAAFAMSRIPHPGEDALRIIKADLATIQKHHDAIDALEKHAYEPVRQAKPEEFEELVSDARNSVEIVEDSHGNLKGICAVASATEHKSVAFLNDDGYCESDKNLYAFDLTLHESVHGQGMGYRLKAEQYIEAYRSGAHGIRGRNREPEAHPMSRLNFKLGYTTYLKDRNQYEGNGTALYQSLVFGKEKPLAIGDRKVGCLKNKLTLSNFITDNYASNMQVLEQFYPERLRHFYLSSGRAEAADKSIRLLRNFRATGIQALSAKGGYFGQSTAVTRSLGGPHSARYFDWPVVESPRELAQYLSETDPEFVLGFYLDVAKLNDSEAGELISSYAEVTGANSIPLVVTSATPPKEDWACDIHLLYSGGQVGVVSVTEEIFFEKPLQMISTWDGDEWSLSLLKEKLLGMSEQSQDVHMNGEHA